MSLKKVLSGLNFLLNEEKRKELSKEAKEIIVLFNSEIKKQKIEADVFLGGSFAKGTLTAEDGYDVDLYVRFDWKYENISEHLDSIISKLSKNTKYKIEKVHGSRDYYRLVKNEVVFEIIPVVKIKKPVEMRNVTDLSYFHVNYVKRKITAKTSREIGIAKAFCKAQGVYGAESYIQGFSGYSLECLIIYYKSFEKFLKESVKVKERVIVDPENKYKKNQALFEINESKLSSPIILIDPTWKERNALAALSMETFRKFQEAAKLFIKKPSNSFFEIKKFDEKAFEVTAKKNKAEHLHLKISTNKQEGDIAGTKLKKFSKFLLREINEYFSVSDSHFEYNDKQDADLFIILKSKGQIVRIGPPIKMAEACIRFKKNNKEVYEKFGYLHAKIKITDNAEQFISKFASKFDKTIKEMDITNLTIY